MVTKAGAKVFHAGATLPARAQRVNLTTKKSVSNESDRGCGGHAYARLFGFSAPITQATNCSAAAFILFLAARRGLEGSLWDPAQRARPTFWRSSFLCLKIPLPRARIARFDCGESQAIPVDEVFAEVAATPRNSSAQRANPGWIDTNPVAAEGWHIPSPTAEECATFGGDESGGTSTQGFRPGLRNDAALPRSQGVRC
jgi:hypothetical protein